MKGPAISFAYNAQSLGSTIPFRQSDVYRRPPFMSHLERKNRAVQAVRAPSIFGLWTVTARESLEILVKGEHVGGLEGLQTSEAALGPGFVEVLRCAPLSNHLP